MRSAALFVLSLAVPAAADPVTDHLTVTASDRLRGEFVSWFEPPPGIAASGAERYAFFANQLRLGARVTFPHVQAFLEMQDTRIANLPDDASLPPPQGNLGTGATYFANTHQTSQGEPFLKQGFVAFRDRGLAATFGRFDYRDGLETIPGDATLAAVKRTRIAERLVGPFDFTHVTRSFDGGRVSYDRPSWNATAFAFIPTQGGFEVSANRELDGIWLTGVAVTAKRLPYAPPADVRLFWLFYDDARRDVLKVDNRPLPVRQADHEAIALHTAGGHAVTAMEAGPGIVDLLAWAAFQAGRWGTQDDAAWAWALEGGYHVPRLPASPWLRLGWDRSSGDDDPTDSHHGTFFQVLPTARIYAQLPFYDLMNSSDVFTELVLEPHPRVSIRTDWHWLQVTDGRDLWYQGGGATNADLFGYAGSPANGRRSLAQLADVTVTVQPVEPLVLSLYYGHAFGGPVVGQSFAGRDADYGFLEATWRFQR
jgi:alginate export protein